MTKTEKNREEKKRKVVMPAGIRNKMVAAVSMLLVASIMMVSSTYAWFTLSTAPEVTGITTNVGANGNLEMMLLNKDSFNSTAENLGVESGVNDSMAAQKVTLANLKWGNLVDLADQSYGLQSIVMNPARLNIAQGNETGSYTLGSTLLKAPTYTSDGRVLDVDKATLTSGYSTDGTWKWNEKVDNAYGVRVIGTTSGVTERLTAYRAAISARAAAIESAKNHARNSLINNGQTLANIVVKAALQGNDSTFEKADLETLKALIAKLKEANDAAGEAIVQTVLAYNLSDQNKDTNFTDADVAKLKEAFNGALNTTAGALILPTSFTHSAGGDGTILKPGGTATDTAVAKWTANNTSITDASTSLETLIGQNSESYTYTQIEGVVNKLINKQFATVGGVKNPGKANANDIVKDLLANNNTLKIEMESGSGIYADIAELVGDYTASGFTVYVDAGSIATDVNVSMSTKVVAKDTTGTLPMIPKLDVGSAPAATLDASVTPLLTDHYGYALDFGFRTNAAASELLLQTDEIQRVYSGDGAATAETTKGGGSYMEFRTSNTTNFSVDELRALMSALRVVFVEPVQTVSAGGTVLTYNVLGVAAADITRNAVDNGATYTYEGGTYMKDDAEVTDAAGANGLKAKLHLNTYEVDGGVLTLTGKKTTGEAADAPADNTLTALTQNVAKKVTAIVYLDGDIVDNTMVANAASSMTGSLNLQFSSSATLKPMENTGMRGGGSTAADANVTYTVFKSAGEEYTLGGFTGKVNPGYTIYKDNAETPNYYYQSANGAKVRLTEQNALTCGAFTIEQVSGGN